MKIRHLSILVALAAVSPWGLAASTSPLKFCQGQICHCAGTQFCDVAVKPSPTLKYIRIQGYCGKVMPPYFGLPTGHVNLILPSAPLQVRAKKVIIPAGTNRAVLAYVTTEGGRASITCNEETSPATLSVSQTETPF
jgi:hypothetical protein